MRMKFITAAALLAAFAMPAFAADEFYLVQDTATKVCSIVEVQPESNTMKVIGAVHKTESGCRSCHEGRRHLSEVLADSAVR